MGDVEVSDTEREIMTKLDQILGIVQDLQVRARERAARVPLQEQRQSA